MPNDRERLSSALTGFDDWTHEQVDHLTDLVHTAVPEVALTPDDLLCLWADAQESLVWGKPGVAAIAGYLDGASARLTLLAVDPQRRRLGVARDLISSFEAWSIERGVVTVEVGAPIGFGPWPGIDSEAADLRGFFAALGYEISDQPEIICHTISTRFRADPPANVEIARAMPEPLVQEVKALVDRHDVDHRALFDLAIEQGTCLVGHELTLGRSIAVLCHSVARTAWIGPLLVVEDDPNPDLVPALVSAACTDLMVAGRTNAQVIDTPAATATDLARMCATPGPMFLAATKTLYREPRG